MFALTHTRAPGAVQGQTLRTLAAERALGVHAAAVGAHAGEDLALVNVCRTTARGFFRRDRFVLQKLLATYIHLRR